MGDGHIDQLVVLSGDFLQEVFIDPYQDRPEIMAALQLPDASKRETNFRSAISHEESFAIVGCKGQRVIAFGYGGRFSVVKEDPDTIEPAVERGLRMAIGNNLDDAFMCQEMYVVPEFRGRGVGNRVVEQRVDHARKVSDHLVLQTGSEHVKRLYDRLLGAPVNIDWVVFPVPMKVLAYRLIN